MRIWTVTTLFSLLLISSCTTTYKTQKSSTLQDNNASTQLQLDRIVIPLPPQRAPENPPEETPK